MTSLRVALLVHPERCEVADHYNLLDIVEVVGHNLSRAERIFVGWKIDGSSLWCAFVHQSGGVSTCFLLPWPVSDIPPVLLQKLDDLHLDPQFIKEVMMKPTVSNWPQRNE